MTLATTFKSKGREYHLALDTDKPDRNYEDENYAEWFVTTEDGRVLDITVWKDAMGRLTHDGTAEVYADRGDFEDGTMLDKRNIRLRTHEDAAIPTQQAHQSRDEAHQSRDECHRRRVTATIT